MIRAAGSRRIVLERLVPGALHLLLMTGSGSVMRRNHDAAGISTHGRKRMTTLFYILVYLAVIGFVATAAIKVKG